MAVGSVHLGGQQQTRGQPPEEREAAKGSESAEAGPQIWTQLNPGPLVDGPSGTAVADQPDDALDRQPPP